MIFYDKYSYYLNSTWSFKYLYPYLYKGNTLKSSMGELNVENVRGPGCLLILLSTDLLSRGCFKV